MKAQDQKRALAALVTVGGVVAIWAWSSMRQGEQTEALSRRWVGEQWDIARTCVTGTPFEGSAEEIADALEARVYETLRELEIADRESDVDRLWPARCVPLFSRLHVDASITDGDPSTAVSTLEVLLPRVMRPEDTAGSVERARELASAIATLDQAMPPGADYDPQAHPSPSRAAEHEAIARSLACSEEAPSVRPFLHARLGDDRLYDERSDLRIVGSDDGLRRITPREGEAPLERPEGLSFPRLMDERIAWLVEGEAAIRIQDPDGALSEAIALPVDVPSAFAPCTSSRATWFVLLVGEEVYVHRAGEAQAALVRPPPPLEGTRWACTDERLVLLFGREQTWEGATCESTGCRRLDPLRAGGDLQLAASQAGIAVLSRGHRTDLPFLRWLEDDAFGPPAPALRGPLELDERATIRACGGSLVQRLPAP